MPLFGGLEEAFDPVRLSIAVLVGVVCVIVGAFVLRTLMVIVAHVEYELSNIRENRRAPRVGHWNCGRCRSFNSDLAEFCYKGCGRRIDVEETRIGAETRKLGGRT
jgi:hypothetical protein